MEMLRSPELSVRHRLQTVELPQSCEVWSRISAVCKLSPLLGWALGDAAVFGSFLLLKLTPIPHLTPLNSLTHQIELWWDSYSGLPWALYLVYVESPQETVGQLWLGGGGEQVRSKSKV